MTDKIALPQLVQYRAGEVDLRRDHGNQVDFKRRASGYARENRS